MITLGALFFTMEGLTITIGLGTLLWIILGALFIGASWTLLFLVNMVGDGLRSWRS
jgi:hypothetical protein